MGDTGVCKIGPWRTSGHAVSDNTVFKMVKDLKEETETVIKEYDTGGGGMEGRNNEPEKIQNRIPRMKKS